MEAILEAKKGKSNLPVKNDLCYHDQKDVLNDSFPKIVPLYDGQELKITQKLIKNGLSTISIRNMKTKQFGIKERNSFVNLLRPELKGLNIVPTENQQERMLHDHILKEVTTIHKIKSMRSPFRTERQLNSSEKSQAKTLENKVKSNPAFLMDKRILKMPKPKVKMPFDQQEKQTDSSDTDFEDSTLDVDILCENDVEIKSTIIR